MCKLILANMLYGVLQKKVYHPISYNIFNNSCLISVTFGAIITE